MADKQDTMKDYSLIICGVRVTINASFNIPDLSHLDFFYIY
jgi:hypothetical protein